MNAYMASEELNTFTEYSTPQKEASPLAQSIWHTCLPQQFFFSYVYISVSNHKRMLLSHSQSMIKDRDAVLWVFVYNNFTIGLSKGMKKNKQSIHSVRKQ